MSDPNGDPYEEVEGGYVPDAHGRIFRDAGPEDHWDDNIPALVEAGGVVYEPIESLDEIDLPEILEERNWDAGALPPKTLEEAKAALAERIADPAAPDDESLAGAYDDIEPGRVKGPEDVE